MISLSFMRDGANPVPMLVSGSTGYVATFQGNDFDSSFQRWWSVLGVALACAVGFGLFMASTRAFVGVPGADGEERGTGGGCEDEALS